MTLHISRARRILGDAEHQEGVADDTVSLTRDNQPVGQSIIISLRTGKVIVKHQRNILFTPGKENVWLTLFMFVLRDGRNRDDGVTVRGYSIP